MPLDLSYLSQTLEDVPESDDFLSKAEQGQLAGFRFSKRRNEWRLGRWTAKQAASLYLRRDCDPAALSQLEIRAAPDGAPDVFVENQLVPVSLSISHGGGRSLCAVGSRAAAVGCDLEKIQPHDPSIVADYFTAEERTRIEQAPDAEHPLYVMLIWCAKESGLKSLREGLRRDTRSVTVRFPDSGDPLAWNPLNVSCLESSLTFHGWWRVSAGFVQVITSALPSVPRDLRTGS